MVKERKEQLNNLVIDFLCHCEIDKRGRLYDPTGKAKHYLEYMKDIYFSPTRDKTNLITYF